MAVARVLVGSSLLIALAACGGGDEASSDDATSEVTASADTTDPAATTDTPNTTVAPSATTATPTTTAAPDPAPATTEAAAPTTVPTVAPVEFDLDTLPGLVEQLADIAAIDPLEYAKAFGFPLEVGVPDGSTLLRIDTTVAARASDDGSFNEFDMAYSVSAPGGTIPDLDINLDDNGPGSVQITEIWDPILTDLGYERKNSTTSDPGDPGGPNTVNHVYVPTEAASTDVNGHPADITTVFVWGDEDMTGAANDSDSPPLVGGYVVDVSADVAADIIPVPLLASIAQAMPVPDDAAFVRAALRLIPRSPDSFGAEKGPNYLELMLEWQAAPGVTPDQLAEFYADAEFDGDILIAAEVPLSGEGPYRLAEVSKYGDTDSRLPVLFLQRYGGMLSLSEAFQAGDPAEITYRVTLNPTDGVLAPPE